MTVKRGGLARSKRVRSAKAGRSRVDSLATTPTQYGETSPDYKAQAGDPDYLKSYSEEQIGLMGGRARIAEIVSARQRKADESGSTEYGDTEFELGSSEAETSEVGAVAQSEIGTTDVPGKSGTKKKAAVKRGSGKRGEKGGLYGRLAKATGTTRKEGRGIMKRARRQIKSGNTKAGARRISRALAGGPKAGVKRTPARAAQAEAAGKKIAKRIATRQRADRKGAGGGGGRPKRRK